ncbi:MAG: hypothetical protein AAGA12_15450 [Pseudomonadota bacterium]
MGRQIGRIAVVDDLRGLCIIAVISTHAVLLFAPRIGYLRCDVLGPAFISCGGANFASLFIANIQAVVVFAFISGLMIARHPKPSLTRQSVRLMIATAVGAALTVVLSSVNTVDDEPLVRLVSPLPFSNPAESFWRADPDWTDWARLVLGIEYLGIVTGRIDDVSAAWPPFWCIPWFIAGWLVLALARGLSHGWSAIVLACITAASLAVDDQGILTAMIAGYLVRPCISTVSEPTALVALAMGLTLALLPEARSMPSDWLTWSPPRWLVPIWQTLAAGLIAVGYLNLAKPLAAIGLRWLGRNSIWIFCLHWPCLLVAGSASIGAGVPWNVLIVISLALTALPFCVAVITLWPCGHHNHRSERGLYSREE